MGTTTTTTTTTDKTLSITEGDIVIANNAKGEKYYVVGKYDDWYSWDFDCAPVGKMITWHRRYSIGTKHDYERPADFWVDVIRNHYEPGKELAKLVLWCTGWQVLDAATIKADMEREGRHSCWVTDPYYLCYINKKDEIAGTYPISTDNVDEMTQDDFDIFWSDAIEGLTIADYESMAEEIPDFAFYPVYMYEHSGIALSLGDFGDPWDSGQLGVFCADRKEVEDLLAAKEKGWEQAYHDYLKSIIEEFNQWQYGNVWRFFHIKAEELDNCREAVNGFQDGLWDKQLKKVIISKGEDIYGGSCGRYDNLILEYCNEMGLTPIDVIESNYEV